MIASAGRGILSVVALLVGGMLLSGCAEANDETTTPTTTTATAHDGVAGFAALWEGAALGAVDYQLGGASTPDPGVTVVVRDREEEPAGVAVDICYVNGFQTQPHEDAWWLAEHPDLVLHVDGEPVSDPGWPDEHVLDTTTPAQREGIAEIIGAWIIGCAEAGYEAIELDNLDTSTRIEGLSQDGNLELAAALVEIAHDAGLAVAQKNALELGTVGEEAGFDLVITEECGAFGECAEYTAIYGDRHIDVEYAESMGDGVTFAALCEAGELPRLTVLRDLGLVPPSSTGHVLERC